MGQKTGAVKGVKLSDTEINTIRGKFSTSVLKITCGKCTAYVKQNRAFAAKGYTKATLNFPCVRHRPTVLSRTTVTTDIMFTLESIVGIWGNIKALCTKTTMAVGAPAMAKEGPQAR